MSGYYGIPYRGIPPKGWNGYGTASVLYSPFTIGINTSSYYQQSAINNNIIQPQGCVPPTGSPYTRIVAAECGDYESCVTNTDWCCDNTGTMAANGCPHEPWLQCNPIAGYNSTFPFTPIYPTASVVTKSLCNNFYGYKNVQAKKNWSGMPGLTDVDSWNCFDTELSCSGYVIDYRTPHYSPANKLYLSMNWNLKYSFYQETILLTGSFNPCADPSDYVPYTVLLTYPVKQGNCEVNRNVSVDRYSGEYIINSFTTLQDVQNYFWFDSIHQPNPLVINDNCGGNFLTLSSSLWWDLESISESCDIKRYDFPGGYFDTYNNPTNGFSSFENAGSPGNLLAADTAAVPNCSNNLSILVGLITIWNNFSLSDNHYNAGTGSGINIPAVSIGGWSGTDSYGMGFADNGLFVTCSTGPNSGSIYGPESNMSPYHSSCTAIVTRTDTSYIFDISIDAYTAGGCNALIQHYIYDYNGSVSLSDVYTDVDLQNDLDVLLSQWNMVDNNIYPWRQDGYGQIAPLLTYNEIGPRMPVNALALIQCKTDDLRSPKTDINGNSPFTTAASPGQKGPPIADGSGNPPFAPCWTPTYDSPIDWIQTWNQMPDFDHSVKCFYWNGTGSQSTNAADGTASLYDGSILGKPSIIPSSGSTPQIIQTGNWDWRHQVWDYATCPETPDNPPVWYLKGYGELNSGQFGIPLTATQWINLYDAQFLPPYAFNLNLGYVGWKQKWAEIKQVWPSWDFNRPYGNDKFVPDETACSCYTDYTTTPGDAIIYAFHDGINPDIFLNPIIPPSTNDIWGGTDVNGFYTITAVSGDGVSSPYSLTTGSLVLGLPSGFTETFCRLRWPNCPDFGTTPITVISNGYTSSVTFQTAQQQYFSSSVVDFYTSTINPQGVTVSSQNPLATNITIHYMDDYHANCSGDLHTANYLISHSMKTWWCDNQPKGQVVTLQWNKDNRTNAEIGRLTGIVDCSSNQIPTGSNPNFGYSTFIPTQVSLISASVDGIPTKNCDVDCSSPGVICFSNNGENFNDHSRTYLIPTCSYDLVYNTSWQGEVVQNQQAFDFQTPHKLCGIDPYYITLAIDDGTCKPNNDSNPPFITQFFGYPYQVEPFLSLPTTKLLDSTSDDAPNPYTNGQFVWWINTPVTSSSGIQPPYNPGYGLGGNPNPSFLPWVFKFNVCSSPTCSLYNYEYIAC